MTVSFHDLAGGPGAAEEPIAQSEIAALTRRYEQAQEKTDREFGIVKSDLTALRLQVGNLDQKVSNLDEKVGGLDDRIGGLDQKIDSLAGEVRNLNVKVDRNQAQIIELLSQLVGEDPDAR
ncbi:hypothetical protein [Streptomyces albipurpureus]|uniref:Uncharacterized protein n=1 Tax=Streptomyces albipurpureus TaxID=2897419 RepID=A0ABT0UIJ2_9ACTN|nr:hypothetical protein [Streptomyces sp. CWNU-1]MCM2388141.1 hypothetical protein [Streptomyces sp. CWNU-1]